MAKKNDHFWLSMEYFPYCRSYWLTFHFDPQVICMTVLATMRIYCNYRRAKPVTKEVIKSDPYAVKPIRKLIDACAFKIYGHWVKKGQAQNRAALFENSPKVILLSLTAEADDSPLHTW